MALNIKDEETHALVKRLAARTGVSQTAAVRAAVVNQLRSLERIDTEVELERRKNILKHLAAVQEMLTAEDKLAIRTAAEELYDESGLPA